MKKSILFLSLIFIGNCSPTDIGEPPTGPLNNTGNNNNSLLSSIVVLAGGAVLGAINYFTGSSNDNKDNSVASDSTPAQPTSASGAAQVNQESIHLDPITLVPATIDPEGLDPVIIDNCKEELLEAQILYHFYIERINNLKPEIIKKIKKAKLYNLKIEDEIQKYDSLLNKYETYKLKAENQFILIKGKSYYSHKNFKSDLKLLHESLIQLKNTKDKFENLKKCIKKIVIDHEVEQIKKQQHSITFEEVQKFAKNTVISSLVASMLALITPILKKIAISNNLILTNSGTTASTALKAQALQAMQEVKKIAPQALNEFHMLPLLLSFDKNLVGEVFEKLKEKEERIKNYGLLIFYFSCNLCTLKKNLENLPTKEAVQVVEDIEIYQEQVKRFESILATLDLDLMINPLRALLEELTGEN